MLFERLAGSEMIGMDAKRESEKSVLSVLLDDEIFFERFDEQFSKIINCSTIVENYKIFINVSVLFSCIYVRKKDVNFFIRYFELF